MILRSIPKSNHNSGQLYKVGFHKKEMEMEAKVLPPASKPRRQFTEEETQGNN